MAAATVGALARIARRDLVRHRSHSLLLVAMIALPVAGLVAGGALLDTLQHRSISHLFVLFGPLIVWSFGTLAITTLAAAVLMAGAAVTIAARRQLRALGLLAAQGARGRQLGAVVLLQAATLGLVGALGGIPAGLLLARALLPLVARAIDVETGPLLVVPGRLLLAGALGLLTALVAALVPAIGAARLPVTAALAARRPPPQHPRWLTIGGLVVVLAGLGLVVLQARWLWLWQPWNQPAMLVGFAAFSPALVALLGRSGRRLPATLRLAVRDLARHPTRSAAAVAAVTAGLPCP
jgi:putative ABC transport system permease protein